MDRFQLDIFVFRPCKHEIIQDQSETPLHWHAKIQCTQSELRQSYSSWCNQNICVLPCIVVMTTSMTTLLCRWSLLCLGLQHGAICWADDSSHVFNLESNPQGYLAHEEQSIWSRCSRHHVKTKYIPTGHSHCICSVHSTSFALHTMCNALFLHQVQIAWLHGAMVKYNHEPQFYISHAPIRFRVRFPLIIRPNAFMPLHHCLYFIFVIAGLAIGNVFAFKIMICVDNHKNRLFWDWAAEQQRCQQHAKEMQHCCWATQLCHSWAVWGLHCHRCEGNHKNGLFWDWAAEQQRCQQHAKDSQFL